MNALFKNWRSFQDSYLQYLSAFLLVSLTLLAILEVIRRYGFGVSFEWQQDAVTYGILSGIFLFFGITQTRNAHLRVTVILMLIRDNFGTTGQIISTLLVILGQFIGIILCGYVILYSIDVVSLMISQDRKTESLVFPLWPFFVTFLTGIGFLGISFFFQLWHETQILFGNSGLEGIEDDAEDSGPIL